MEDELSHYLTSLQIENYANSNDFHEAVLDRIVEHGHSDDCDDIPLKDYSIFYFQQLGDEKFERLDSEEVVNQLVGWKGIPVSSCGEIVEILDEMVKDYFIQHANEDAYTYTFVYYYTKLQDRSEILDGEKRELSLETDWELFSHLV
ncbi:B3 domain-containing protein [Pyrus ussuriensis x Pyrus communis]|uniref:B3 domain-containing protein n=1 Tax=Pyrus ussuriensis x Pyrus communis TaxID=2448454 RepID=A0A5N5IDL0_9ROSA|nr:B3 domain-containing protein [Pyrus ussuriensis x Pyrus communis]